MFNEATFREIFSSDGGKMTRNLASFVNFLSQWFQICSMKQSTAPTLILQLHVQV